MDLSLMSHTFTPKVWLYERVTIIYPIIISHEIPTAISLIEHRWWLSTPKRLPHACGKTQPRDLVNEDIATKFLNCCGAIDETSAMKLATRDLTSKNAFLILDRLQENIQFETGRDLHIDPYPIQCPRQTEWVEPSILPALQSVLPESSSVRPTRSMSHHLIVQLDLLKLHLKSGENMNCHFGRTVTGPLKWKHHYKTNMGLD